MTKKQFLKRYKNNFTKDELVAVIFAYDDYIQEANDSDRYETGWRPVCIDEFVVNETRETYPWDKLIKQVKKL